MKKLSLKKFRDIFPYLFFGVCTTLVNVASYWVCARIFKLHTMPSTIIAWVLAVLFAYVTNRKWVFHSTATNSKSIAKEITSFFACRLATGIIDWLCMFIFVDLLKINDIVIKISANILVIILNYLASKFVIFQKNSSSKIMIWMKTHKEFFISFLACCVVAFLFLTQSPMHPWRSDSTWTDSSVFKTIALMMQNGYMPYKDSFDHKGPLLYLINWLGLKIAYYRGVWVFEFLFMTIAFLFFYKIARLTNKISSSILICAISISMLFPFFESGNLTEEYALPFIAISIFIFLDYLINANVSNIRLIICGMCLSAVCLLRLNMISVWVVFCFAILFKTIFEKNWKQLGRFILFFLTGFVIFTLPFIIWLGAKNSLKAFIDNYIIFNMEYSSSEISRAKFSNKWKSFIHFATISQIFIIALVGIIYNLKKNLFVNISYLAYMILTLIFMALSGQTYGHYGMILIPLVIYPLCTFSLEIPKISDIQTQKVIKMIILAYSLVALIIPNSVECIKKIPRYYETRGKENFGWTEREISAIIENRTSKDEKISVYGNWDIIYVLSHRMHATKYSYQIPIIWVRPSIKDEYFSQLGQELPPIIVVEKGRYYDADIQPFLQNHDYKKIWPENIESNNASAFVFYRENR